MNLWEQKKILLVVILVLLGVGVNLGVSSWKDGGEAEENYPHRGQALRQSPQVSIYISGEVVEKGVYQVKVGTRVKDALLLAKGVTACADLNRVNLAKLCKDGMHINVPRRKEAKTKKEPSTSSPRRRERSFASTSKPQHKAAQPQEKKQKESLKKITKVNLNTATVEELAKVPGMGRARANAIVEYRKWHRFYFIWELKNVSGISKHKAKLLKEFLEV